MRIYRVQVLKPLEPRQRRHLVHMYRVGAESKEQAIAAVRAELADREHTDGWRIVGCNDFCAVDLVTLDSIFTCSKERAANYVNEYADNSE
jgi:hypothetical protein